MKASWESLKSVCVCLTGDDDRHQTEAGEGCGRKWKVKQFYCCLCVDSDCKMEESDVLNKTLWLQHFQEKKAKNLKYLY